MSINYMNLGKIQLKDRERKKLVKNDKGMRYRVINHMVFKC